MNALSNFIESTLKLTEARSLTSRFDPQWRSACELFQDGDTTYWRPIEQSPRLSFDGLANALEQDIHPDIQSFYTGFWSGTLEAMSKEGRVSLIQLWNADDFDRLIANLIGHALAKQRSQNAFSVFFANTEPDSELFLSIDNESGVILLEEPGKSPLKEVESDIRTFLQRLEPQLRSPDIY